MNENVASALKTVSAQTGVEVSLEGNRLRVAGATVSLPTVRQGSDELRLTGERGELLGIHGLLPTVPHGDDRDKLLWRIIAEAAPDPGAALLPDGELNNRLHERLALTPEASEAVATALKERFFNRGRLLPVHASLPLNYEHTRWNARAKKYEATGYTMFNGGILPFLLWNSKTGAPNTSLIQSLLDAVAADDELTSLDHRFLGIALQGALRPHAKPEAAELVNAYQEPFATAFASVGGPFCEPSLALFERDLQTVLATELPRPERARWLSLVISLHLCIRLYRMAVALGSELDLAVAASSQLDAPAGIRACTCSGRNVEQLQQCPLASAIRFRTGTGRFRPVRVDDGCHSSYREVDRRRLLDMPATLVTRTLAARAWAALEPEQGAGRRGIAGLSQALIGNPKLRREHGAACAAIAVLHHDAWRDGKATREELERVGRTGPARPGLHALREDVRLMRGRSLRRQSTDVVNQLMLGSSVGSGSLISRNGPSFGFFEVDEELLLLLVRLVCRDRELPVDDFFRELRAYGLAPQDEAEREDLTSTLERLGLLERYSDAGEASFVHYA
ncbi:DNA phosphorothioation-dependent restriction protein DptG [Micromonospora profundi]|uniref:DNA phosphorothioation-dependent restriction protein DptG n=1 Tax=Micromonospora profundi TaxID=1420889 RepID=UPI003663C5BE